MNADVTTQSIAEKIKLRIIPLVSIVAGLGALAFGAALFLNTLSKKPASVLGTYIQPQALTMQSGVVLIRLKPGATIDPVVQQAITGLAQASPNTPTVQVVKKSTQQILPDLHITASQQSRLEKRAGLASIATRQADADRLGRWYRVELQTDLPPAALVRMFQASSDVEVAEPSPTVTIATLPNDNYMPNTMHSWGQPYADLWGLHRMNMPAAWSLTTGNPAVTVAVTDTGVDINHQDLVGKIWSNTAEVPGNGSDDDQNGFIDDVNGWDFRDHDNLPLDMNGHGTHVSGTVAAATNNNQGVAGVGWNIKVMPVRLLSSTGGGNLVDGIAAVTYAVNNGADVVNISWGAEMSSAIFADALTYAYNQGVVVVGAAGNNAKDARGFSPPNDPHVIAVSAWCPSNATVTAPSGYVICQSTGPDGARATFSNFGPKIDVAAPGIDILSTRSSIFDASLTNQPVGTYYTRLGGTSMAAPHVSGLAALVLSAAPTLTPDLVRMVLRASAQDVGPAGFDNDSGYGVVQAHQAISLATSWSSQPKAELFVSASQARVLDNPTTARVVATVRNAGLLAATNVTYQVRLVNGATSAIVSSGTIPLLSPGSSVELTKDFPITNPVAAQQVEVVLNSDAAISEYLTSNNTSTTPLGILALAWPKLIGVTASTSSLTAVDLDGNGTAEIITGLGLTYPYFNTVQAEKVYVWNGDGTNFEGWPKAINPVNPLQRVSTISTAADDLDGNAQPEIIAVANDDGGQASAVYVWRRVSPGTWSLAPGWPVTVNQLLNKPIVADLDNDGHKEIVITGGNKIFAWRNTGVALSPVWPKTLAGTIGTSLGIDMNQDNRAELVTTVGNAVTVWRSDGTVAPGWPKTVSGTSVYGLAAGDVDHDGGIEIVATDNTGFVTVWRSNGTILNAQWPKKFGPSAAFGQRPILLDVNGDGKLEIVVVTGVLTQTYQMHVLDNDANEVAPWPYVGPGPDIKLEQPSAGDVTGDGQPEILFGQTGGVPTGFIPLYALKADKTSVPGWPQSGDPTLTAGFATPPILADVDGDGKLEVIGFASGDGVYVWNPPVTTLNASYPWPASAHDNFQTSALPLVQGPGGSGACEDLNNDGHIGPAECMPLETQ